MNLSEYFKPMWKARHLKTLAKSFFINYLQLTSLDKSFCFMKSWNNRMLFDKKSLFLWSWIMDEKIRSTLAFFDYQDLRASHTHALKIKDLFRDTFYKPSFFRSHLMYDRLWLLIISTPLKCFSMYILHSLIHYPYFGKIKMWT